MGTTCCSPLGGSFRCHLGLTLTLMEAPKVGNQQLEHLELLELLELLVHLEHRLRKLEHWRKQVVHFGGMSAVVMGPLC